MPHKRTGAKHYRKSKVTSVSPVPVLPVFAANKASDEKKATPPGTPSPPPEQAAAQDPRGLLPKAGFPSEILPKAGSPKKHEELRWWHGAWARYHPDRCPVCIDVARHLNGEPEHCIYCDTWFNC